MLHNHYNNSDEHWAASTNGAGHVLVQVQDVEAIQSRIRMLPEQAIEFATEILLQAQKALHQIPEGGPSDENWLFSKLMKSRSEDNGS